MSCSTGLQLAAKHLNEVIFVEPAATLQQINAVRPLPSYQRQQQQLILQPHRHQQPQLPRQQQHQPPGADTTTAITACVKTFNSSSSSSSNDNNNNDNNNNNNNNNDNTTTSHLAAVQSKRKEKARIAARVRRSQEASIIMEMAGELCISQEKLRRIDKATIVKLAIDYIRAHGVLCNSAQDPPLCSNAKQLKNSHKNINNTSNNSNIKVNSINEQQQQHQLIQLQHNYDDDERLGGDQQHSRTRLGGSERATKHQRLEQDQDEEERRGREEEQQQQARHQQERQQPLYSAPRLATASIFTPKTMDNMNSHFLMIEEKDNGKGAFVLKPDTEIHDEDDLTHLAPQAGDISISLDVEPLEGIPLEDLLIPSPTMVQQQQLWMR